MKNIINLIAIILIIAIVSIAVLLNKDNLGSVFFWGNLAWIVFLVFINIAISGLFYKESDIQNEHSSSIIALLPSINILVFFYSLISIGLISINIFSEKLNLALFSEYHLIFQIAIASLFLVVVLLTLIAGKGADKD
jgi:hypothetical protein